MSESDRIGEHLEVLADALATPGKGRHGGEEFRVRRDPPLRRRGRWSLRVLIRVAYEPTLRRWPRVRLTVEPTWHR